MALLKTAELTGAALDWAVAIAEGFKPNQLYISKYQHSPASIFTRTFDEDGNPKGYMTGPGRLYSKAWEAGGPIIEREGICLHKYKDGSGWSAAYSAQDPESFGPTPLIAAMRCYVSSELGNTVDVPDELLD